MRTRAVKILRKLIEQTYPIDYQEFARKFQVSSRTIRSDIKEINATLSQKNLPVIQTIRGKGLMISLSKEEKSKIDSLVNNIDLDYYSNKDMRILNLILEFSFGNIKFIYEKQKEFQVSKSTIDTDMKDVRELLDEYHLSLTKRYEEKIEIQGAEKAVRVMLFNTINKILGSVDIYDAIKIQTPIYQILFKFIPLNLFEKISYLYEEYINSDDVMYKNQSVLFVSIWLTRLSKDYFLEGSSEITEENNIRDSMALFLDEVESEINIKISDKEKNYIRLILETLVSETITDTTSWTKGQIITLELIAHVQKELDIPLNRQEELFSGLFKHIVKLITRLKNNMQISNPLTEEIKNNNPQIFQSIKLFNFNIDSGNYMKITDDEIAFIAIYFLLSISQVRQSYHYLYKAVVFCNHGKATGQLLAQMLEENFDIDVVAILSPRDLSLLNKLDVDVAFSTINLRLESIPLLVLDSLLIKENYEKVNSFLKRNIKHRRKKENPHKDKKTNSLLFEDLLSLIKQSNGEVTEEVYKKLDSIFRKYKLPLNEKVAQPSLIDILKDEHISFNLEAKNWSDAITKSATSLLTENIITENYIKVMIQALEDNGPYIVMAPHVALAHAKPEDGVKQVGISVSKLKKPIVFGHSEHDPVKVIFCIAPVDSYTHINIMKDIFEIINNEKVMQKLLNSKNIDEFKEYLTN